jgi:hypothetical protein
MTENLANIAVLLLCASSLYQSLHFKQLNILYEYFRRNKYMGK